MKPEGTTWDCTRDTDRLDRDCELCPLSALECGQSGRVVRLAGAPRIARRLLALGLVPGSECRVLGRAPANGPIRLRVGSIHLMLRTADADGVIVGVAAPAAVPDVLPSL